MNSKTVGILAVITLIVVAFAAQMTRQENTLPEPVKLFPDLAAQGEQISTILIKTADSDITLEKQGDVWGIQQQSGYPADPAKVRQTLLGMADMTTIEAKTLNPDLYERLGLRDVETEGAKSVLITLQADDSAVASLLVGNQQTAKTDPTRREFYVRKPDEEQTWLVISSLNVHKQVLEWVEQEIINLERNQVQTVEVTHYDGDSLTIYKDGLDKTDYQLADVPPKHKVSERYVLGKIGNMLSFLRMEDVKPAAEFDFSTSVKAVFTTFDGLAVTMRLLEQGDTYYATFSATALPNTAPVAVDENAEEEADTVTAEQQAAALNAKLQGWAFVLPSYKAEHFYKKMADLTDSVEESSTEALPSISDGLDQLSVQPFMPTIPDAEPTPTDENTTSVETESSVTTETIVEEPSESAAVEALNTESSTLTTTETVTSEVNAQITDAVTTAATSVNGQITDAIAPVADVMGEADTIESANTVNITSEAVETKALPTAVNAQITDAATAATSVNAQITDAIQPVADESGKVNTVIPQSTLQLPVSVDVGHVGTVTQ